MTFLKISALLVLCIAYQGYAAQSSTLQRASEDADLSGLVRALKSLEDLATDSKPQSVPTRGLFDSSTAIHRKKLLSAVPPSYPPPPPPPVPEVVRQVTARFIGDGVDVSCSMFFNSTTAVENAYNSAVQAIIENTAAGLDSVQIIKDGTCDGIPLENWANGAPGRRSRQLLSNFVSVKIVVRIKANTTTQYQEVANAIDSATTIAMRKAATAVDAKPTLVRVTIPASPPPPPMPPPSPSPPPPPFGTPNAPPQPINCGYSLQVRRMRPNQAKFKPVKDCPTLITATRALIPVDVNITISNCFVPPEGFANLKRISLTMVPEDKTHWNKFVTQFSHRPNAVNSIATAFKLTCNSTITLRVDGGVLGCGHRYMYSDTNPLPAMNCPSP